MKFSNSCSDRRRTTDDDADDGSDDDDADGGRRTVMGIKGLPSVLEPWCAPTHVNEYPGARAAVDAYSWLHKGTYACATALATGDKYWERTGEMAPYVRYCVHRANLLRHHGITPVMVFDGDRLPAKRAEEEERRRKRRENMAAGHDARAIGDSFKATNAFAAGMDVTPEMARELILVLKREGVEFVVAPYEADGQIASLAMTPRERGGVDLVFTEDSDLVAYGCATVIFKLEKSGDAKEFRLANMLAGPPCGAPASNEQADGAASTAAKVKKGPPPLNFKGWDYELFLSLCVMSGCDFLDNIRGLGIKKMYNILNKYRDADEVFKRLRTDPKVQGNIPDGYEHEWHKARLIFKHAVVYDVHVKKLRHLSPLPETLALNDLSFLGPIFDDEQARLIAEGEINPISRRRFEEPLPKAPAKTGPVKFGLKRKQEKANKKDDTTSAQRSMMMNFFTKMIPKSPKKKASPAKESAKYQAPALDDIEDDDELAVLDVDALTGTAASKENASTSGAPTTTTTTTIELISDDEATLKPSNNVFQRSTPPRKASFLTSLFSPSRAKKTRVSPES